METLRQQSTAVESAVGVATAANCCNGVHRRQCFSRRFRTCAQGGLDRSSIFHLYAPHRPITPSFHSLNKIQTVSCWHWVSCSFHCFCKSNAWEFMSSQGSWELSYYPGYPCVSCSHNAVCDAAMSLSLRFGSLSMTDRNLRTFWKERVEPRSSAVFFTHSEPLETCLHSPISLSQAKLG